MSAEQVVAAILARRGQPRPRPADALIDAANEAGGRDNITVVLFRLEDGRRATAGRSADDVGVPSPATPRARPRSTRVRGAARRLHGAHGAATAAAAAAALKRRPRRRDAVPAAPTRVRVVSARRRSSRSLVVLSDRGGGYLATRSCTSSARTPRDRDVYRGLPCEPAGRASTSTSASTAPACRRSTLPAERRAQLLDHACARASDVAADLIGQISSSGRLWAPMSARNRELLGLVPASLLVTAGFAAVFIQRSDVAARTCR